MDILTDLPYFLMSLLFQALYLVPIAVIIYAIINRKTNKRLFKIVMGVLIGLVVLAIIGIGVCFGTF